MKEMIWEAQIEGICNNCHSTSLMNWTFPRGMAICLICNESLEYDVIHESDISQKILEKRLHQRLGECLGYLETEITDSLVYETKNWDLMQRLEI